MPSPKIIVERDNQVAYLILNNEARHNAISLEMFDAIRESLRELSKDDGVRVLVVRGAGNKAFAAGADISEFESQRATPAQIEAYVARSEPGYADLYEFPKPTIAMIRGWCVGGGFALAAACDVRLCDEAAKFCNPSGRVAVGWGASGIRRVVNVIGPSYTKEMVFTGRNYTAQQAQRMGFVSEIFPAAAIESATREYAAQVASLAPLTLSSVKRIVGELMKDGGARNDELCRSLYMGCYTSADYVEGRRAFMEKRKPHFVGR